MMLPQGLGQLLHPRNGIEFAQYALAGVSAAGIIVAEVLPGLDKACVVALQLAAAVLVALLRATLGRALMERLVPQMNVCVLSSFFMTARG